jgi:hypothetical protein
MFRYVGGFKMEESEELLEEINGIKRKSAIAILNKENLSKYEMDELFAT